MSTPEVLRAFRELEQHLCKLENRTSLFRTNAVWDVERGHHAMAGRILSETQRFFEERRPALKDAPTKKQIAAHMGVSPNHITSLLQGFPTGSRDWFDACRETFNWLLLAVYNAAGGTKAIQLPGEWKELAQRMREFLFRATSSGTGTETLSYLAHARRAHKVPCSLTELGQTIAWYGRQPDVGSFRSNITILLGLIDPRRFDPLNMVVEEIRKAAKNDAVVRIVHLDGEEQVGYAGELRGALRDKIRLFRLSADGLFSEAGERIAAPLMQGHPPFVFGHTLHMSSPKPGDDGNDLICCYYLRHYTTASQAREHEPVGHEATLPEERSLREVIEKLETVDTGSVDANNTQPAII